MYQIRYKKKTKKKKKKKKKKEEDDALVLVEKKRDHLKMKPKSEITRYKQQQQRMIERESVIVCNGSGDEQPCRLQKDIIDQRMRRVHVYSPTKDPRLRVFCLRSEKRQVFKC